MGTLKKKFISICQERTLTMKNRTQKGNYHGLSINENFEANVVDVKILTGAGDP